MGPSLAPLWTEGLHFRESKAGARGCLLAWAARALPSYRHSAHLCRQLPALGVCPSMFYILLGVALPASSLGSLP